VVVEKVPEKLNSRIKKAQEMNSRASLVFLLLNKGIFVVKET